MNRYFDDLKDYCVKISCQETSKVYEQMIRIN